MNRLRLSYRWLAALLALLLCLSSFACQMPAGQPEATPSATSPSATDAVQATPEPTATPEPQENASQLLAELDHDIFVSYAAGDGHSLAVLLRDPAAFGIDVSEVPETWGEFTEEDSHATVSAFVEYLERLQEIDRAQLDEQEQLSYDIIQQFLEQTIAGDEYEYYYEPLTEYTGLQVNLPLALWLLRVETQEDAERYLALAADTPRYLDQVLAYEQERAERGLFMTESALDAVLSDLDQLIRAGDDLFLIDEFEKSLGQIEELTDEQRADYAAQARELLSGEFLQAFSLLRDGLEALRASCREPEGMYALGEEALSYYALQLQAEAASDITPEDAMVLLEQEFLYLLISYQTLSLTEEGMQDPGTPLTSGDVEQDLADLRAIAETVLPEVPEHTYTLRQVPEELEDLMSPAAYAIPPLDEWEDNIILLNPSADQTYLFLTLAHEGYPGHMYQYLYQRNLDGLGLMQRAISFSGYYEGWAQFAEELAILAQDKYNRSTTMMQFCNDMASNALLLAITSIKVNYEGMEPEDLKEYLSAFGLGEDMYVDLLFEYAVNMPFYALSYAVGYAQLASLMRSLSADMGENYVQKDVLTQYLNYGPAYFNLLRERMDVWADEQLKEG